MTHEATNFAFGNRSRTEQGFLKFGFLSKNFISAFFFELFFQWIIYSWFSSYFLWPTQHFYNISIPFSILPLRRVVFFLCLHHVFYSSSLLYSFVLIWITMFSISSSLPTPLFSILSYFLPFLFLEFFSSSLTTLFLFYPIFIFLFSDFPFNPASKPTFTSYTRKNAQPVPGWWEQAWTMLCCTPWTMLSTTCRNIVKHNKV